MERKNVKSSDIFIPPIHGSKPITIHLTFSAGHWTLFGSVHLRFQNFPVEYQSNRYEVDFLINKILWPVTSLVGITSDYLHFNGVYPVPKNVAAFEKWVLAQILASWNDPSKAIGTRILDQS